MLIKVLPWFVLAALCLMTTMVQAQCNAENYQFADYDSVLSKDKYGRNDVETDYYRLALSWSPGFCRARADKNGEVSKRLKFQCKENQFAWVVHGLWGQVEGARRIKDHPRYCEGDLPKVNREVLRDYLCLSPSASLLQGEWEKHGACDFETFRDYYEKTQALFVSLKLPTVKQRKRQLINWLKSHNPQLKNIWIGVVGNEIHICYDKLWNLISCPR